MDPKERKGKKKKAGGGGSNRKVGGRGGKKKELGSRVRGGTQPPTPGQGCGQSCGFGSEVLGALPQRGRWGGAGGWGSGASGRPGRALGRRLPSPGPPARTSGGCARGARGRAGGPAAGPPEKSGTNRCLGLGRARAPGREIPMEEPPGTARGAGSRPRRSPAIAPSPADAGGARVSGRKRLSHFLRSPHSSAPSAPDLPSLSPAPFPSPAARVGAGKTRNLNGCSVRRLPPGQVSSRSQPPACLPALPTVPRARQFPVGSAPVWAPWSVPAGMSPDLTADRSACQHPSSHSCAAACFEPVKTTTLPRQEINTYFVKFDQLFFFSPVGRLKPDV